VAGAEVEPGAGDVGTVFTVVVIFCDVEDVAACGIDCVDVCVVVCVVDFAGVFVGVFEVDCVEAD
jgi:hypothetical protein